MAAKAGPAAHCTAGQVPHQICRTGGWCSPLRAVCLCVGLAERTFGTGWCNHCQSFKHQRCEAFTEISGLIWELKDEGTQCAITWKIVARCQACRPRSGACDLCTTERLMILRGPASVGSGLELVSKCRHSEEVGGFLIMNCSWAYYCIAKEFHFITSLLFGAGCRSLT